MREKRPFLRHFVFKTITLPSQARDKHRETQQKEDGFCRALNNAVQDSPAKTYGSDSAGFQGLNGAETLFFFAKPFLNDDRLPRQALDTHRHDAETLRHKAVFRRLRTELQPLQGSA